MKYLILAQICLTVGTPNWVVVVCYVCFGIECFATLLETIAKIILEKN